MESKRRNNGIVSKSHPKWGELEVVGIKINVIVRYKLEGWCEQTAEVSLDDLEGSLAPEVPEPLQSTKPGDPKTTKTVDPTALPKVKLKARTYRKIKSAQYCQACTADIITAWRFPETNRGPIDLCKRCADEALRNFTPPKKKRKPKRKSSSVRTVQGGRPGSNRKH